MCRIVKRRCFESAPLIHIMPPCFFYTVLLLRILAPVFSIDTPQCITFPRKRPICSSALWKRAILLASHVTVLRTHLYSYIFCALYLHLWSSQCSLIGCYIPYAWPIITVQGRLSNPWRVSIRWRRMRPAGTTLLTRRAISAE